MLLKCKNRWHYHPHPNVKQCPTCGANFPLNLKPMPTCGEHKAFFALMKFAESMLELAERRLKNSHSK